MFLKKRRKESGRIVAYINDTPIRIGDSILNLPEGICGMDIPGTAVWNGIVVERAYAEKEARKYLKRRRLNDVIFFAKHGMIGMSLECLKGCIMEKRSKLC